MAIRRITDEEVRQAIMDPDGEVIEEYRTDKYSPSCLIYGRTAPGRVLHVQANHAGVIITAYDPDPQEWIDLKRWKP